MDLNDPIQISIIVGIVAFIGGYLIAKLGNVLGDKDQRKTEDPRNHRIRELEADLRLAERQLQDQGEDLSARYTEVEDGQRNSQDLEASLTKRDEEITYLKHELKLSCAKTVELRKELTSRAEQTIRGTAALDSMQTELHVAQAGSDAVLDEINRLNKEREELTDTVRNLKKLVAED